uniref:lysozyme n=1 Tax=Glossina austeni TaxID=7395 RepID=A0A1A9V5U6_GLOAU
MLQISITRSNMPSIVRKPKMTAMIKRGVSEPNITSEYVTCARNRICSEQTINNYMQRYSRDCNQDGIIDCQDYIALQVLGRNGCTRQQMSTTHDQSSLREDRLFKVKLRRPERSDDICPTGLWYSHTNK